ncbi:leucine-rich PPR motif-containing protein, mitochondrial-like [Acropora millepora]|uniref:leucine-rich PPR motif-containing protein, mitochondrial-like n=1 Tax=Acropora millepora TaxID=45264 RepID=UPI001CF4A24C|nr:leucine-rich PPR motif-containing protein, mitochondrial-like [Acropora millepora]
MAAVLRIGAARTCRLLSSCSGRNPLLYQQKFPNFLREYIWRVWQPCLSGARYLSNEYSPSEERDLGESSESRSDNKRPFSEKRDFQKFREEGYSSEGGDFKYQRQMRQLGTLFMKSHLIRAFEEILKREGGITSLQAYQVLRNCGTELVYEKPEDRVKLAHGFWDQLMEIGVKPDVMLHNALLSVYIQNNHTFDPLEVLEKMENSNIDPNRTTLLLLIQGYAQKGDIAGAFKVLEFIKEAGMPLTEQVFSALITAYGFNGDPESARGVFDLMRENGLEPELDSYTALLGIYGEAGDMEAIMSTLSEMQDKRVHPNKKVFLTLLNSLSKRGHHGLIRELLQTSIVKSLLDGDLKDLMLAVATRGEISSAFIFLNHMIEMGSNRRTPLRAEFALLRQVILSGQPVDLILVTISELEKLALFRNVYEDALDISYNKKNPELTRAILEEMLQKKLRVRVHYFYPLLSMYANKEDAKGAQEVVNLIGENGLEMTGPIFRFLIKSYGHPNANDVEAFINFSQDVPVSKYLLTSMAQLVMSAGELEKLQKTVEYTKKEDISPMCISDAFAGYMSKKDFDPRNGVEIVKLLDSLECTQGLSMAIVKACDKCNSEQVLNRAAFVKLLLEEGMGHHLESRAFTYVMGSLANNKMPTEFYEFVRVLKENSVQLDTHHYRQMIRMLAFDGKAEAAQFCFEKAAQLEEPAALMYSYLMQAYANCPEGGMHARIPMERNMKRIIQLYDQMWEKGFSFSAGAKGAAIIAHLYMGNVEVAEEIRRALGLGQPKKRVLFEFLKSYSKRGDVAKTQQIFDELKVEMKDMFIPPIMYNNLIFVYGFHGDSDTQWKVFEEMKNANVKPNLYTYSNLIRTLVLKDNIEKALKLYEEVKVQGNFVTDATCLTLLNSMARTGQTELFESVVEDIITNRSTSGYNRKWMGMLRGLMFCCVHAGKNDLALKIQLEHEVRVDSQAFTSFAENSAKRGEVLAVLNAIEFFKENEINTGALYVPLIRAHDTRNDLDAVKGVYQQMVTEGMELTESFVQQYNQILLKYGDSATISPVTTPQMSTGNDEDQFSSEEAEDPMDEVH